MKKIILFSTLILLFSLTGCKGQKDDSEINLSAFKTTTEEELSQVCERAKYNFLNTNENISTLKTAKSDMPQGNGEYWIESKSTYLVDSNEYFFQTKDNFDSSNIYVLLEGDKTSHYQFSGDRDTVYKNVYNKESFKYMALAGTYCDFDGRYSFYCFPTTKNLYKNMLGNVNGVHDEENYTYQYKKLNNFHLIEENSTIVDNAYNRKTEYKIQILFSDYKYKQIYMYNKISSLNNQFESVNSVIKFTYNYGLDESLLGIRKIKDMPSEEYSTNNYLHFFIINAEFNPNSILNRVASIDSILDDNYKVIIPSFLENENLIVKVYLDRNKQFEVDTSKPIASCIYELYIEIKSKTNSAIFIEQYRTGFGQDDIYQVVFVENEATYELKEEHPDEINHHYSLSEITWCYDEIKSPIIAVGNKVYLITYTFN